MNYLRLWSGVALLLLAASVQAGERIPLLQAGDKTYTNVVVMQKTATEVFVKFDGGMGNLKIKTLPPEWQKKFNYDPAKAAAEEAKQAEANRNHQASLSTPAPAKAVAVPSAGDAGEKKIWAKRMLGQKGPDLFVEKWLTAPPSTAGKFVLVDFWATWCGPCRKAIPELNTLHQKFGNQLVVIGISDETEAKVRAMQTPKIDYFLGIDAQGKMKKALEVTGIPHVIIMDPAGIIRWEGYPLLEGYELTEKAVADVLARR